jgi:hypothetical protein
MGRGYHMFLTYNGLTTVEYIKSQTTKRVLKENAKLVTQMMTTTTRTTSGAGSEAGRSTSWISQEGGGGDGDGDGGRSKRFWTGLLRRIFLINPEPESLQARAAHPPPHHHHSQQPPAPKQNPPLVQRSNNLIIGRLCRPDTDPYIDWTGVL